MTKKREQEHTLKTYKEKKRQIEKHIELLKEKVKQKQWSEEELKHNLEKEIKGRTAKEWIEYYNKQIAYHQELLRE